jgi:hypothetical protein
VVREDQVVIREKAVRLAVRTGIAPDLDLVWDAQQHDEGRVCFGAYRPSCPQRCRWLDRCRLLSSEPVGAPWLGWTSRESLRNGIMASDSSENRWIPDYLHDGAASVRRDPPPPV